MVDGALRQEISQEEAGLTQQRMETDLQITLIQMGGVSMVKDNRDSSDIQRQEEEESESDIKPQPKKRRDPFGMIRAARRTERGYLPEKDTF